MLFTCLLLSLLAGYESASLAYLVRRNDFSFVRVLSCSTILTEKYVFTSSHPIQMYPINEICAIGCESVRNMTEAQLQEFCKPAQKFIHPNNALVLIELQTPLYFQYSVNTAMVPHVPPYQDDINFFENCITFAHARDESGNYIVSRIVISISIDQPSLNTTFLYATVQQTKETAYFCIQDNGIPVKCQSAVIGLMVMSTGSGDASCCVNYCKPLTTLRIVAFLNEGMQSFFTYYYSNYTH